MKPRKETPASFDEVAVRAAKRRRHARRQLYLLNIGTGWGLGHLFFTVLVMGISPRLHGLMQDSAVIGPVAASVRMTAILMEPAYFWAGVIASIMGAASGWCMGWFQVRVLDHAGELVRSAQLEQTVAHRTVDLTLHNQRMAEMNARLEEARRDIEARHRELRSTQEKLVRSERLAAVTETAVSVNHEINGPLMVILGQSEMLQRDLAEATPEAVAQRVQLIQQQSLRIAEITRKLATLVEPVSGSYLEDEGIRMLDLERSRAAGELTASPR